MVDLLEEVAKTKLKEVASACQIAFTKELDRETLLPWAESTNNKQALELISFLRQGPGAVELSEDAIRKYKSLQGHFERNAILRSNLAEMPVLMENILASYSRSAKEHCLDQTIKQASDRLEEKFPDVAKGVIGTPYEEPVSWLYENYVALCELASNFDPVKPKSWQLVRKYNQWQNNNEIKRLKGSNKSLGIEIKVLSVAEERIEELIGKIVKGVTSQQSYYMEIGAAAIRLAEELKVDPVMSVKSKQFRDAAYRRAMGSKEAAIEAEKTNFSMTQQTLDAINALSAYFAKGKTVPGVVLTQLTLPKERSILDELQQQCLSYKLTMAERIFS